MDKKMAKAKAMSQLRAKAAEYEADSKRPLPKTWSARMPAYAGTVLCWEPGRRKRTGEETGNVN